MSTLFRNPVLTRFSDPFTTFANSISAILSLTEFCHFWNIVKSKIGTKSKNGAFSLVNSFDSIASAVNGINKKTESMFVTDS